MVNARLNLQFKRSLVLKNTEFHPATHTADLFVALDKIIFIFAGPSELARGNGGS